MQNQKTRIALFSTAYILGVIPGLALIVVATWADLESTFYGFNRLASTQLSGLSCPILMTREETSSFSLKLTNTLERRASPTIRVDISTPNLPFSNTERFPLEPGETLRKNWEIGPENIDLSRFVFTQVVVYSMYPIPNRQNGCGIFVVDLPGSGWGVTWIIVAVSVLGMGIGLYGLNHPQSRSRGAEVPALRPFVFLSIMIVIGIIASIMGWWFPGIMILVVSVLLIFSIIGMLISRQMDKIDKEANE